MKKEMQEEMKEDEKEAEICHPCEENPDEIDLDMDDDGSELEEETKDAIAQKEEKKAENKSLIEQLRDKKKRKKELVLEAKILEKK